MELKYTTFLYHSILKLNNICNFCLMLDNLKLANEVKEKIMKLFNISDSKNYETKLLSEEEFIWVLYNNSKKSDKPVVLFGNKIENEKNLYNIFEIIDKNEKNSPINTFFCKSLIDTKYIIILKIFIEYYIKNETPFELILEEINKVITEIHKKNVSFKNYNIFIQIDNQIFSFKKSYLKEEFDKHNNKSITENTKEKMIEISKDTNSNKEMKEIKINLKENTKEKKILDIPKEANNIEIQELKKKLNDALSKITNLMNKNDQLEKELKNEKNKNKISEDKIKNLQKQLDDEIKKSITAEK